MQDSTASVVGRTVTEVLDILAARFGTTAAHLWNVMVQQSVVEGIKSLTYTALMLGLVVGGFAVLRHAKSVESAYDAEGWYIGGSVLMVIGFIGAMLCGIGSIGYLANPEYYALQDILKMLK